MFGGVFWARGTFYGKNREKTDGILQIYHGGIGDGDGYGHGRTVLDQFSNKTYDRLKCNDSYFLRTNKFDRFEYIFSLARIA